MLGRRGTVSGAGGGGDRLAVGMATVEFVAMPLVLPGDCPQGGLDDDCGGWQGGDGGDADEVGVTHGREGSNVTVAGAVAGTGGEESEADDFRFLFPLVRVPTSSPVTIGSSVLMSEGAGGGRTGAGLALRRDTGVVAKALGASVVPLILIGLVGVYKKM